MATNRSKLQAYSANVAALTGTKKFRMGESPARKAAFMAAIEQEVRKRTHPLLLILGMTVSELPPKFKDSLLEHAPSIKESKKIRSQSQSLSIKKFMESLVVAGVRHLKESDVAGWDMNTFMYNKVSDISFSLTKFLNSVAEDARGKIYTELFESVAALDAKVIAIPGKKLVTEMAPAVDVTDLLLDVNKPNK